MSQEKEGRAFRDLWSNDQRREALRDFWRVYDEHYDELTRETTALAAAHPEFGPIMRQIPPEELARRNVESKAMLERAIAGEWDAYELNLRTEGAVYARLGISFGGWYDIVGAFQRSLVPRLVGAYQAQPGRLAAALVAMQTFLDRAMAVIAEQYLETKETVIREQREVAQHRAEELARSEESLRRQTTILDSILQSMRDGVVVADAEGKLILRNDAATRLMGGLTSDPQWSLSALEFFGTDGATRIPVEQLPLVLAVRGQATDDMEVIVKGPSAERDVVLRIDGRPLRDRSGSAMGGLMTFRDVTELRKIEATRRRSAELEGQNRRIQEANRLKSEFLANMSHELRTPLNSIIGFAQLLHDGDVPSDAPEHKEFLGNILHSGRHLLKLINDVLDLAKVEAGKMEFHPEPLDPAELVHEVVGIVRSLAAAKRIRMAVEVDPEIQSVEVDGARLKQILYNYLSNALKFTSEGGRVTVRLDRSGQDDFRISVADTGNGILPEDIGKLFVEFQQLDTGAGKKHGGTGLGLALTRKLVEAQGGTVGVESRAGEGSTFFARLPRAPLTSSRAPRPLTTTAAPIPGQPTVLIIEDDPEDQEALARALTDAGYAVVAASNGHAALLLCQERTFDAITLDLLLPDMSGLDVLNGIRAQGRNVGAPIVVVTVVAEKGVVTGYAVVDVLSKPLERGALLAALERAGVVARQPGVILVVDDDAASVRLMEAVLAQIGHRSLGVADGSSALQVLEHTQPLAIVLDLNMPGMDGFTLLNCLRRLPALRHTPVVIWTVRDLSHGERDRLRESAQAIVQKGEGGAASVVAELRALLPTADRPREVRDGG